MSADAWEERGPNKFFFRMSQPIPSYLIALAIGDLVSAEVGPRWETKTPEARLDQPPSKEPSDQRADLLGGFSGQCRPAPSPTLSVAQGAA